MKNVLAYLEQLGFSETETKLYIILLKSGPLTVADLAEKSKINRTAAYAHINSLLQKGIITKVKGSTNKIGANPPDHLHYLVEQKAIQVGILQEKLPSVISVLNSSIANTNHSIQQETKYYKGEAGVKIIYKECLKTDILRTYFNASEIEKVFPENIKLFNNALDTNPKMKMLEILEDSPAAKWQTNYWNHNQKYFYKFLPNDIKLTANDILLYNGKVAIINIKDRDNIDGVVLENRDYYNNSVQLFDLLWRLLPEPKI